MADKEEALKKIHADNKALYDQKRWVVWLIHGTVPFTYTSGAILTGRPDLYVAGLAYQMLHPLVNAVLSDMPENAEDSYFQQIRELKGFDVAGTPARYKFVPMTVDQAYERDMLGVFDKRQLEQTQTRFYELVLAGPGNILPDEKGYVEWRKRLTE